MLRLFSVALLGRFCCANEATWPEVDKQKKIMALFVHYHYKGEVYCESTVRVERRHNFLLTKGQKKGVLRQIVPSTEIYLKFI